MRARVVDQHPEPLLVRKRTIIAAAALVLLVGGGTTLFVTRGETQSRTESSTDEPATRRMAQAPRTLGSSRRVIGPPEYQTAIADAVNAGAIAFRAYTDDFCDAVKAEVEAQMAREKLTEAEVRELTYFGMLAKTSLDWNAVEAITGHPIHPNARRYAQDAMFEASSEMKRELRAQVEAGADETARRATIERIERAYLDKYNHLTGMDADLLDMLLWQYVQEHPSESIADVVAANQPAYGANTVDRKLNYLPPPPPPPADSPPPAPATPSAPEPSVQPKR